MIVKTNGQISIKPGLTTLFVRILIWKTTWKVGEQYVDPLIWDGLISFIKTETNGYIVCWQPLKTLIDSAWTGKRWDT
jgi:hypothetical protein